MNEEAFINKVFNWFPEEFWNAEVTTLEDILLMRRTIADLHKQKYSFIDAINYCRCFEEVSPDLDEDIAITRMTAIRGKYPEWRNFPSIDG
jgi:hypothetical protein